MGDAVAERCQNLTAIDLRQSTVVTDKGLSILSERFSGLTEVNLDECPLLTDGGLAQLIERCPELHPNKVISQQKGDKFITSVCKSRPEVTKVNLGGCEAVTDPGLAMLLAECRELEPDAIVSNAKSDSFCAAVLEH